MKPVRYLFFPVILLNSIQIYSQATYQAGTGQSSIEPYQSLISLHLGGYGAPRDGRFTLQWSEKGDVPEASALCGINDKLYTVSNGTLMSYKPSDTIVKWRKEGRAENILSVTGLNGKFCALNTKHEILVSKTKGSLRWSKTGITENSATAIASVGNTLFATSKDGNFWTADLSTRNLIWKKSETVPGIISIASDESTLYALTDDGVIYKYHPSGYNHNWSKIAYKNGETIRENIRLITILNNRLFGISDDNILYMGEHRSEGNLTARALAINCEGNTIVIVNVDVCGLTGDFTGLIKKEILERHQLSYAAVFINSSHTHFAPVSQNWLTWQEANQRPDSTYLYSIVRNGILTAVDRALGSMAPAELYFGRGTTDIGYNRSLKDHPELYDSDVDVLKIAYTGKRSESYLFLAACHPVFSTAGKLHYTISANYPGVARTLLEERTGSDNSLFLQGTAGDINPKDNGEYISGEKLANDVMRVLNRPMKKIEGPISFFLDTVDIPITPWTKEEIRAFREQNKDKTGNVYAEKNLKWCDLMMDYYDKGIMPKSLPEYVHTINIGNWKLVGFSRETTTGYGLGVKKLWPEKLISVAGYTNDVSSYLPTHMHLEAENYEGLESFFWYGMANVFPLDADEIIMSHIKSLAH
jgi:hypothetical protein